MFCWLDGGTAPSHLLFSKHTHAAFWPLSRKQNVHSYELYVARSFPGQDTLRLQSASPSLPASLTLSFAHISGNFTNPQNHKLLYTLKRNVIWNLHFVFIGAHLNPVVTLALLITRQVSPLKAFIFVTSLVVEPLLEQLFSTGKRSKSCNHLECYERKKQTICRNRLPSWKKRDSLTRKRYRHVFSSLFLSHRKRKRQEMVGWPLYYY